MWTTSILLKFTHSCSFKGALWTLHIMVMTQTRELKKKKKNVSCTVALHHSFLLGSIALQCLSLFRIFFSICFNIALVATQLVQVQCKCCKTMLRWVCVVLCWPHMQVFCCHGTTLSSLCMAKEPMHMGQILCDKHNGSTMAPQWHPDATCCSWCCSLCWTLEEHSRGNNFPPAFPKVPGAKYVGFHITSTGGSWGKVTGKWG